MTPAVSSTIACLIPTRRLNRVDLPTLGRPTIATSAIQITVFTSCTVIAGTVLTAMKGGILVLETADAALPHLLVGAYVVFREFFLPEEDVDSESEHAECYKGQCYEEQFHLEYEIGADGLVVVHLVDDACEHFSHSYNFDFGVVLEFGMRYGVGDEHLFENRVVDPLDGAS